MRTTGRDHPMGGAVVAIVVAVTLTACGDRSDAGGGATVNGATSSTVVTTPTTVSTGPSQTTTTAAVTLDCETVGFTPSSEDAASSIRATGVSCEEARSFVKAAGAVTSSGGPAQVEVQGYRCARTHSLEDPIPQAFYECTRGSTTITYVRT